MMLVREILHHAFGMKFVLLFDHDGAIHVRRVYKIGKYHMARRVGMGIRTVILQADGTLRNGCYVKRWEPLLGDAAWLDSDEGQAAISAARKRQ